MWSCGDHELSLRRPGAEQPIWRISEHVAAATFGPGGDLAVLTEGGRVIVVDGAALDPAR